MARCSGTGLEGVTPSLIGENLANRHSCQPPPAVAVNQHCHFFITSSTAYNLEASVLHYAPKSHKRKACSVWVSLHVMRIPLYAKKCEARSAPCLRPGALATPNFRFSQVHATEERRVGGSFGGIFIFSQFSGQIYSGIWSTCTEAEYPTGGGSSLLIGIAAFELTSQLPSFFLSAALCNSVGVLWKAKISESGLCTFCTNLKAPQHTV